MGTYELVELPKGRKELRNKWVVEKDLEGAIVWFWKVINEGDKVESALKDMAVVMNQLDRTEEAIEAVKSFRLLCPKQSQHSIGNVLIDLYKKCGKVDEQIAMLRHKHRMIYNGETFNGKPTKSAKSHGKRIQVSVKQETSRLLGNLGWAYMQKGNYIVAEVVYKKTQMVDPDSSKACILAHCLIKKARFDEARSILEDVVIGRLAGSDLIKIRSRAEELLLEIDSAQATDLLTSELGFVGGDIVDKYSASFRWRRLPIFEEISPLRDQLACVFLKSVDGN
ncbi:protein SULFUR DEFICIENCY-INDUCED 1-like [Impatiens glandulifera]|uniref:protein SULFUR DEFICIENCY-INDUCED 1-like n=1 Tax=Impatiens glandulifera TaxID=253017 RepID=UPI001FB13A60|nr:protein SULFUR DEFICIENCY-INDUCED 1-like [Impatiens glandulifera]